MANTEIFKHMRLEKPHLENEDACKKNKINKKFQTTARINIRYRE